MVVLIKLNEMYIEYEGREVARLTVRDYEIMKFGDETQRGFEGRGGGEGIMGL